MKTSEIPMMSDSDYGPHNAATVLDMYFCSAPPAPEDFEPELKTKPPAWPVVPKMTPDMHKVWQFYTEEGEFLDVHLDGLPKKDASTLRLHAAAIERTKKLQAAYNGEYELQKHIQWRWFFARAALAKRAHAHREIPGA